MLKPGGYAVTVDPKTGAVESDTVTCAHCGHLVFVPHGKLWEVTGGCHKCGPGKYICLPCVDVGTCVPIEKLLELMESI